MRICSRAMAISSAVGGRSPSSAAGRQPAAAGRRRTERRRRRRPTEPSARQHAGPDDQRPGVAGLRRERLDRSGGRLGHRLREGDGLQGQADQIFGTSDEAYTPLLDEPGAVRRHLRVGRREPAARPRRLRPAGQPRPVQELRRTSSRRSRTSRTTRSTASHYGVPHGRGSNLLMWRTDKVTPAPTSWAQMFDPANGYKVSDLRRADLHRRRRRRPDEDQARPRHQEPVRARRHPVRTPPSTCSSSRSRPSPSTGPTTLKQMDDFRAGNSNVGTTWQIITNLLQAENPPVTVDVIKPTEGATGWSDTWMINSKTKNLDCAYAFIDYLVSPEINAKIAEWFGEAPGNSQVVRADRRPEPLRHLPRRRRRVLEGRLVLADARGRLRRRPDGREVQGLRRLDQGLDRDQGLTRPEPAMSDGPGSARRIPGRPCRSDRDDRHRPDPHRRTTSAPVRRRGVAAPPSAVAAGPASWPCRSAWLGVVYLGLARRPVPQRVLVDATRSPASSSASSRSTTSSSWPRPRSTASSPCGRVGMAALVTADLRRRRLPDRLLHGPGRVAAHARASSSSPSSCRSGRATSSRPTRGA